MSTWGHNGFPFEQEPIDNPKDLGEWFYNHELEQARNRRGAFIDELNNQLTISYIDIAKKIIALDKTGTKALK